MRRSRGGSIHIGVSVPHPAKPPGIASRCPATNEPPTRLSGCWKNLGVFASLREPARNGQPCGWYHVCKKMRRSTGFAIISILVAAAFGLGVWLMAPGERDDHSDDEARLGNLLAELRGLEGWIEGCAVGVAGQPGRFFILSQYFFYYAGDADLERMLADESAVVRAMGALCFVARDESKAAWRLRSLQNDPSHLTVFPYGCNGETMTLGTFVKRLQGDGEFLSCFDPTGMTANACSLVLIRSGDKIRDEMAARGAALAFFRAAHPDIEGHAAVEIYAARAWLTRSPVAVSGRLQRGDPVWMVEVINAGSSDLYPTPDALYWVRALDGSVFELAPRE